MDLLLAIPFYLAIAAYVCGGILACVHLKNGHEKLLDYGKWAAATGNTLLLVVFILRWYEWKLIPFTGLGDSLNLFLILFTGIALTVQRGKFMRPMLTFYLPALGIIAILVAVVAPRFLADAPKGELNGLLLTIHVGLVFLAMALFFVSSLTSLGYIYISYRLKAHTTSGLIHRLPSLEQLDKTLFRLIAFGYPTFVITILFGIAWAFSNPELLPPQWYLAPKYLFTASTLILFAASFYIRKAGLLRGPKLAYIVFVGFTTLMVLWIALEAVGAYDAVEASQ